ncbi:hypothetical protein HOI83_01840 [Candidatus Uhrbacteria bacterium]|jgi:hypothetical protein|nr:hypothetical protein [Candidatus Uhrbacteria bacterium]
MEDLHKFRLRRGVVEVESFPTAFERRFDEQCGSWSEADAAHLHYARAHWHHEQGQDSLASSYIIRAHDFAITAGEMVLQLDCGRMTAILQYTAYLRVLEKNRADLVKRHDIDGEVAALIETVVHKARTCGDVATYVFALLAQASITVSRLFLMLAEYPLVNDPDAIFEFLALLTADLFEALDSEDGRALAESPVFMEFARPQLESLERALRIKGGEGILAMIEARIKRMSPRADCVIKIP